ncbi:MAG: hypothetical protein HXY25_01255 [Alphaproteobacteria bacterium]|nr:hypothetical protein [Alphaproteobacteria bacterium]
MGRRLAATRPGLLTIILPRHPERGGALAETLRGTGFELARRSAGEPLRPSTEIYLADTLGEVGLFIRLAAAVMMGGSFVPVGGHNPLEPALLGRPVLYGPLMESFAEICARLEADGLAEMVADEAALAAALARHLETPAPAAGVEPSAAARRLAAEGQAVLAGVLAEVDHHLPTEQRGGRGAG